MFSSAINLTSMAHSFRRSFADADWPVKRPLQQCAEWNRSEWADSWGTWQDTSFLQTLLNEVQAQQQHGGTIYSPQDYFEQFIGDLPSNSIVYYAQGARFALSREQIRSKPLQHYASLLEHISNHEDPYQVCYLCACLHSRAISPPSPLACLFQGTQLFICFPRIILTSGSGTIYLAVMKMVECVMTPRRGSPISGV